MKNRYGEDSPAYHVRVLGNFPPSESDTVIPVALIDHAMKNDIKVHEDTVSIWALDVARQGNDSSVLCKRQGPIIHPLTVWNNLDLMQLSGAVKAEYDAVSSSKNLLRSSSIRWEWEPVCWTDLGAGPPGKRFERVRAVHAEGNVYKFTR